ncbi:MAG: aminotransferase class V-fold PLP-dependent enzyme [Anaerolineae bacterium]|nr:aminotransferase class V-fold PLP-dependent enzyme [Anaerolineae bacterium]
MQLENLRELFLLDPEVAFFNHGSFGACPKPVFEEYQRWQRDLEWQPVDFLGRRREGMINEAREKLADYLHTPVEDLIFVVNATQGVNTVARSLKLQPGDEILTTNHEYGAINKTWAFVCERTGARMVEHHITLPATSHESFVEAFWAEVTPRTRVISISHITSPTALIFPIAEICRRAREAGILTVIDGAHAPGQIPVDLTAIGADFYSGNCHKWLSAPKGAGFLFARREHHLMIDPLVISHGWGPDGTFASHNEWQGTRDISAFLTVPAAIDFQREHDWDSVRARCHRMAVDLHHRIGQMTGLDPIATDLDLWFAQMISIPMPKDRLREINDRLYYDYKIVPAGGTIGDKNNMRISIQGYNTPEDCDRLVSALAEIL